MRILFISSGNALNGISPLVDNQGISLIEFGHHVDFFTIQGKGLKGYTKSIFQLNKYTKGREYNLIHAHYGLSGIIAFIANRDFPLVVSFMGDDLLGSNTKDGKLRRSSILLTRINRFFASRFYRFSIVKSPQMFGILNIRNAEIIPNGVDLKQFYPEDKKRVRDKLNLSLSEVIIVFVSNPERPEKNYSMALEAVKRLNRDDIRLVPVFNKNHDEIRDWLNASDVVILTSYHEGSPNIVKEAMACNCPIISTDVGDVKINISDISGCYVSSFNIEEFANDLERAIEFGTLYGKTKGREEIIKKGLDSHSIAKRINDVYQLCLKENNKL